MAFKSLLGKVTKKIVQRKILLANITFVGTAGVFATNQLLENWSIASNTEHNYLYRLQLKAVSDSDSTQPPSTVATVAGQTVNFADTKQWNGLVEKNRQRIYEYYKKFNNQTTFVNIDTISQSSQSSAPKTIDYFIQQKTNTEVQDLNREWLSLVKLNQLSVDRFGFEYDEDGKKKTDSTAAIHKLVNWKDVDIASLNVNKLKDTSTISLSWWNNNIEEKEIKIFKNKDQAKYQIPEENKDINHDWFIWLDKDLLTLRLNYIFQTWLLIDSKHETKNFAKDIIGNYGARSSDEQAKYDIIKANYDTLSKTELDFAANYDKYFFDIDDVSKDQTIDTYALKPDNLNSVYIKFLLENKDASIFSRHLLATLKAGDNDTIKNNLGFEDTEKKPDDKNPKEADKKDKSILAHKTSTSKGSEIKFSVDKKINIDFSEDEVVELIKDYSVQEFELSDLSKTKPSSITVASDNAFSKSPTSSVYSSRGIFPIFAATSIPSSPKGVYTTNTGASYSENIHALKIPKALKSFNSYFTPALFALIFLSCCALIIATIYKIPGLIGFFCLVFALFASQGLAIALGFKFSDNFFAALLVLFFIGIAQLLYFLNSFEREYKKVSLAKSAISKANKLGLSFTFDTTFATYVFASLFCFICPIYLREFGIILALGVLLLFVFNPLFIFANITKFVQLNSNSPNLFLCDTTKTFNFLESKVPAFIPRHINKLLIVFASFVCLFIVFWYLNFQFNSDFIYKKSYLIGIDYATEALETNKSNSDINAIITQYNLTKIKQTGQTPNKDFFLTPSLADLPAIYQKLSAVVKPGAFSIQETYAYSDINAIAPLFRVIKWTFLILSFYLFLRFGLSHVFNLWIGSSVTFGTYLIFVLGSRTPINHLFNLSLMILAIFVIVSVMLLSNHTKYHDNVSEFLNKDSVSEAMASIVKKNMRNMIFDFYTIMLLGWSMFILIGVDSLYLLMQIILAKIFILLIMYPTQIYIWKIGQLLKTKIYGLLVQTNNNTNIMDQIFAHSIYDEETIEGINKKA